MKKGYLATIQYIPDLDRNERLNIGIVLHSPLDDYLKIEFIRQNNRLKTFDDEIDINFYKIYTKAIAEEFTPTLTNVLDIKNDNLLRGLTYNYVNQFQFFIEEIVIDGDVAVLFEEFKKFKLHFDFDKKERLTAKEKFSLLEERFFKGGISVDNAANDINTGVFDEMIKFDFKIKDTYIKYFQFEEKNYKHLVNQIKVWIYNDKTYRNKFKMIFVIEDNVNNNVTRRLIDSLKNQNKYVFEGIEDHHLVNHLREL